MFRVVPGVPLEAEALKYAPKPHILLSIQKWSAQPPLFTCDWSFHIPVGLEAHCSGSTQDLKSTCLAAAVLSVFHPLPVHLTSVEAF